MYFLRGVMRYGYSIVVGACLLWCMVVPVKAREAVKLQFTVESVLQGHKVVLSPVIKALNGHPADLTVSSQGKNPLTCRLQVKPVLVGEDRVRIDLKLKLSSSGHEIVRQLEFVVALGKQQKFSFKGDREGDLVKLSVKATTH